MSHGLPPEIQRDRDVERLARKANLPPYMWDTLDGLAALGRFMDAARATARTGMQFPSPGEIAALRKVPYKPGVAFPDHSYEEGWNDAIHAVGKLVVNPGRKPI